MTSIRHLAFVLNRIFRVDHTLAAIFTLNADYAALGIPPFDAPDDAEAQPEDFGCRVLFQRAMGTEQVGPHGRAEFKLTTADGLQVTSSVSSEARLRFGLFWSKVFWTWA